MEKSTPNLTTFMQNKPNLPDAQMNVNSFRTTDYDDFADLRLRKNKAEQSQFQNLRLPKGLQPEPLPVLFWSPDLIGGLSLYQNGPVFFSVLGRVTNSGWAGAGYLGYGADS